MKLDLAKTLKPFYTAASRPQRLTVPAAQFLAISGKGDPEGHHFISSIQALYTAAYSIKNYYKQRQQDFTVCKLEGLWWVEGHYLQAPREQWQWQLLIRMPDYVTAEPVQQAIDQAFVKKQLPLLKNITLVQFEEGDSVQVMHTGPFSTEAVTLQLMEDFFAENQLKRRGKHHEIYLSDPHKTAPEKMRTILRQAVE